MIAALILSLAVSDTAPEGFYVEARTAAVFAGACHFGAQYTTQGREAALGWHFEGGEHAGVPLAGVDMVVVVAGEANLDVEGTKRTSVVYVGGGADSGARAAAVAWLQGEHASLIGRIRAVRRADVAVGSDEEGFWLRADDKVELRGSALPERACCTMPYRVWYRPFTPVRKRLVGKAEVFRCSGTGLERSWSRPDENSVFFGAFGRPRARASG